ncbi:MAG: PAS domain S-box protein, partial [Rhizobiaceae bacterium]
MHEGVPPEELRQRLAAAEATVDRLQRDSDHHYRAFFDSSNVAMVIFDFDFDADGRPVDCRHVRINPALETICGFRPQEILGRRMTEVSPAEEAAEWIAFYSTVLTTGVPDHVERFSPTMQRWIKVSAAPFGPRQIAAIFENITERVRAEDALRDSENRYRSALRVGKIGSWETNYVTGVRHWSPEGLALFGIELPGGLGKVGGPDDEWRAALHPDEHAFAGNVTSTIAGTDQSEVEYRILRAGGEVVWLHGYIKVAERDANGAVVRSMNVAADVTGRRLAEAALRDSESRFQGFGASSLAAIWIRDARTFAFEYVNSAVERIFGISRDRIL